MAQAPPCDTDAEGVVLAECIADGTGLTFDEIRAVLDPEDFYSAQNRDIFSAVIELVDAGLPIDITAVASRIREKYKDRSEYTANIATYLLDVIGFMPVAKNPMAHAQSVKQKSRLRRAIRAFDDLRIEAHSDIGPGEEAAQR